MSAAAEARSPRWRRLGPPTLLFLVTLILFHGSPVRPLVDARYSILLTETLLTTGGFTLDQYFVDPEPAATGRKGKKPKPERLERRRRRELRQRWRADELPYQLEYFRGHLYYYFPPGTSLLSLPVVAALRPLGFSSLSEEGRYDGDGERRIQKRIATLLMAVFAVLVYLQARLLLNRTWSLVVGFGATLGTQVWSTASRVLWSHTWMLLLLAVVAWLLLSDETGRRRLGDLSLGALLATLLAWAYFTRPTAVVAVALVIAWLAVRRRRALIAFAAVLAGWVALGITYSWVLFGRLLPLYFTPERLGSVDLVEGLAGHLVSPSRGLLVFVPQLLFVFYLLIRYRARLGYRLLLGLCLCALAAHWLIVSSYPHWWGGHSYGPRLMIDTLPWQVLLAICALEAWRRQGASEPAGRTAWRLRLEIAAAALLLGLGIFLHGAGANSRRTSWWNAVPQDVDEHPERLWDWSDPQFLAWRTPRRDPFAQPPDGRPSSDTLPRR